MSQFYLNTPHRFSTLSNMLFFFFPLNVDEMGIFWADLSAWQNKLHNLFPTGSIYFN